MGDAIVEADGSKSFKVGERIESEGYLGTVRYCGELPSTTGREIVSKL
jgi:hypothetical protein